MSPTVGLTIRADGSQGIAELLRFRKASQDVAKDIQQAFGQKLKQTLEFAAIEQAIQRTAQWANEIDQTSKALGITAEQLQTLNIIANQTGTSQSTMQTMFENITKAANEAISGTGEMRAAFNAMGVDINTNMTAIQAFDAVMNKVATTGINNRSNYVRNAMARITGVSENQAVPFAQTYVANGGQNMAGASNTDVTTLSTEWTQFKNSIEQIGAQLSPIAALALSIVKILTDALGGVAEVFKNLFNMVTGLLTGDSQKILDSAKDVGKTILNMMFGVVKVFMNLADILPNIIKATLEGALGKFGKKITNAILPERSVLSTWWGKQTKKANDSLGISGMAAERGQAIGDVAGNLAMLGTGNIAKGLQATGDAIGSETMFYKGVALDDANSQALEQRLQQYEDKAREAQNTYLQNNNMSKNADGNFVFNNPNGTSRILSQDEKAVTMREIAEAQIKATKGISIKDALNNALGRETVGYGLLSSGASSLSAQEAARRNSSPSTDVRLLPNFQMMTPLGSGGGGNLRIGGMFAAGEVRIIRMTERMVNLLGQIANNTSPYASPRTSAQPPNIFRGGLAAGF